MTITTQQVLEDIARSRSSSAKDVGYYNIEITENNKEITRLCSSSGLASLSTPSSSSPLGSDAVALPQEPEALASNETLPDEIKPQDIKRAIIQYWHNPDSKIQHKLKVTMNCDFGDGEQTIEWIAAMTKDLGNYKKFHPECSRDAMIEWTDSYRKRIMQFGVKPYLGKFHENRGWNKRTANFNQIEPYTSALMFWDENIKSWCVTIKIYGWEFTDQLGKDRITNKQVNLKAQTLWLNPIHYPPVQRPLTWAQRTRGRK